jgi:hypothetical protein
VPQVRSDQVVEAGKWVGTRHLRIIVGSNCAQHAVLAVPGRQSPDPVAMPRMWETNVTTMLSVGHAAEPRYRRRFRDGSPKAWGCRVFLVVVDRRKRRCLKMRRVSRAHAGCGAPDVAATRLQT